MVIKTVVIFAKIVVIFAILIIAFALFSFIADGNMTPTGAIIGGVIAVAAGLAVSFVIFNRIQRNRLERSDPVGEQTDELIDFNKMGANKWYKNVG